MEKIDRFNGKYEFLSNFYFSPVIYDEVTYPTVEHAYQAAKSLDADIRTKIKNASTPGQAKKLGKPPEKGGIVILREDWEDIKINIMKKLVRRKFQHKDLAKRLVATRDAELIEGNWWGDMFWGVCKGTGQNNLGKILMEIRKDLTRQNLIKEALK